jgi:hypothetical protein
VENASGQIAQKFAKVESLMTGADVDQFRHHRNTVSEGLPTDSSHVRCTVCKSWETNVSGDLVSCDCGDQEKRECCRRVHHKKCVENCLAHNCFSCGKLGKLNANVSISCRYCIVSYCAECAQKLRESNDSMFICPICTNFIRMIN